MSHLPENINKTLTFNEDNLKDIYLAGGCYWGVDAYMARIRGVYSTEVGFANGNTLTPTYEDVCKRNTGHAEVVHIKYDETEIPLMRLINEFFVIINPYSVNKQGEDEGTQYRTGIYYTNEEDKKVIDEFIKAKQQYQDKKIMVEVLPLDNYYPAHEEHQDYLEKNEDGYCHINIDSLNDRFPWGQKGC